MRKSCQSADHCSIQYLILFILELEKALEDLVDRKVGGMRRNATTCYDLGTFPEPEQAFFAI